MESWICAYVTCVFVFVYVGGGREREREKRQRQRECSGAVQSVSRLMALNPEFTIWLDWLASELWDSTRLSSPSPRVLTFF